MRRAITTLIAVLTFGTATMLMSTNALAEEWPFVSGDYWEVTGIDIKDGGGWKYANWLASEWRENQEFAKSNGWIKNYMVIANVYARSDEPDIYLLTVREDIPSGAVGDQRGKEYREWKKKSIEKMQAESGNRAEYRTVMSDSLLQILNFRD